MYLYANDHITSIWRKDSMETKLNGYQYISSRIWRWLSRNLDVVNRILMHATSSHFCWKKWKVFYIKNGRVERDFLVFVSRSRRIRWMLKCAKINIRRASRGGWTLIPGLNWNLWVFQSDGRAPSLGVPLLTLARPPFFFAFKETSSPW